MDALAALLNSMCARMQLLKRARKKFVEIDRDRNGIIDQEELVELANWVLRM